MRYKAIMVDDDYPVLELLSTTVKWEELGFELCGMYENGVAAYEAALHNPPDLVITDIGMPKMNGLELLRRLKALREQMRAIIITCHDEFEFAKQAMQLHVRDYLVKESFVPDDLHRLLSDIKQQLDREEEMKAQMERMRRLTHTSSMLVKQRFIRQLLQQPLLHLESTLEEAEGFGISFREGRHGLAVIAHIDDYQQAKRRFIGEDTLIFALANVFDEALAREKLRGVNFIYDARCSYILFSYRPDLKLSIYAEIEAVLGRLQAVLQRTLKLSMSFIIGMSAANLQELQSGLQQLALGGGQRFYMQRGGIALLDHAALKQGRSEQEDLFVLYDQALAEFREALLAEQGEELDRTIADWIERISSRRYPAEQVKDWALKLLLDMKLRFRSSSVYRRSDSADVLHKEIGSLTSLREIEAWLSTHCHAMQTDMRRLLAQSSRAEIETACRYIERHLTQRITLDEVAGQLHLNASYFSRLFRREMGITFIEYVTKLKMERAQEMLEQTAYPISKICELLGYENQSYFVKTFKGMFGMTPSEVRRSRNEPKSL